jgi:hypothetical protein
VTARSHVNQTHERAHTSINVTLNAYGHLFPDAFADVGEALDRLVRAEAARAS